MITDDRLQKALTFLADTDEKAAELEATLSRVESDNLNLRVAISYFLEKDDMNTWLYSRTTAEELARKLLDKEG